MKINDLRIKLLIVALFLTAVFFSLPRLSQLSQAGWKLLTGVSSDIPPVMNPLDEFFYNTNMFVSNHIIAYYGHPNSRYMGILGRYSKDELRKMLLTEASNYDATNGDKGVVPAFYLIYATCQPGGELAYLNSNIVMSFINYTYSNKMLLYLDHQIGKYGPENAIRKMLPFLKYPNVQLAVDPEWRTDRPMKEIGHITGEEINQIQSIMQSYILSNHIRGIHQLVFHQFKYQMILHREKIQADYYPVLLVHNTSGWGPPWQKLGTHAFNSLATNMPYKGFKLWYYPGVQAKGLHYDSPLMSPADVLALKPQPGLIIYQ